MTLEVEGPGHQSEGKLVTLLICVGHSSAFKAYAIYTWAYSGGS